MEQVRRKPFAVLTSIALLFLCMDIHAQATDVDCEECVDASDIAAGSIKNNKIAKFAVQSDKIAKQAVTSPKIAPAAVTTGKIANGAVTVDKVSPELQLAPIVLDGNNSEIGQLISIGENFWSLLAISQSGYIQSISIQDGMLSQGALVYQSSDCSGTPYAIDTFSGHVQTYFDAYGIADLYYVDKAAVPLADFDSDSISYGDGCYAQASIGSTVWPVTINNPPVTGVSSMSYSLPIRIDRAN